MNDLITFAPMNDEQILTNPIWSALTSDNASLGTGTDQVRLFDSDVAPFAGLASDTSENFQALFDLVENGRTIVLFSPKQEMDSLPFEAVVKVPGYQMVFEAELPNADPESSLVPLTEKNIPKMLALTQLAQPGPFAERTIAFGGYLGIFDGGQLVSMGGQRLKSPGFVEISAVCSHPDHSGKGYARKIVNAVVRDIISSGNRAYLHVRSDNTRAVELYRRMGFAIRRDMNFYVLKKR